MVSSRGPTGCQYINTFVNTRMGLYCLTKETNNGCPVYQQPGDGNYLYVSDKWPNLTGGNFWMISNEYPRGGIDMYHPEINPTLPLPPVTGWKYRDLSLSLVWRDDDQLTVMPTGMLGLRNEKKNYTVPVQSVADTQIVACSILKPISDK